MFFLMDAILKKRLDYDIFIGVPLDVAAKRCHLIMKVTVKKNYF